MINWLNFDSIINVEYTAQMEQELDEIAEGHDDYVHAFNNFEDKFEPLLANAYEKWIRFNHKKQEKRVQNVVGI